jgi:hypothetical protein
MACRYTILVKKALRICALTVIAYSVAAYLSFIC